MTRVAPRTVPARAAALALAFAWACAGGSSAGAASPGDLPAVPDPGPGGVDVPATDVDGPCTVLFGLPNDKTGLTSDQCRPSCQCGGKDFTPPAYTESQIAAIAAMVPLDTQPPLTEDPYAHPESHVPAPDKVCGVLLDAQVPGGYHLQTYDGVDAAVAAGARVTHENACGLCSPLQDLVVYMRNPDLTDPVRQCGLTGMFDGDDAQMQCLRDLGFDENCARIWFYNTKNTQAKCQDLCMAAVDQPYHNPDGTLNACLVCDEEQSGPVFKAVAGRNRRNTGLPSSMCRPCSEVLPIVHDYR